MTQTQREVRVGPVTFGNDRPLCVIAGPCQIETRDHALRIAETMAAICAAQGAGYVFKASYDKANRTALSGRRGPGMEEGLRVLAAVRETVGCPVLTDVHAPEQCAPAAEAVDILQIPAFLCRQTDLLLAAGRTGAAVNVKKGQFLAPWDMAHVADKVASTGNTRILLTERGVSFGYNALVADMRALPVMARTGWPVVMDATHAVQQPGGLGGASGGQREFAPVLARAAVSLGIAAVFLETHEDPDRAPSDGPNMIPLERMEGLVASLVRFDRLAKAEPLRV
ncbi:3-deoxy-8-phosphooctulonate synthase [Rubellimicrobium sp. CFH 75288]|uniref:3-deoxy-8-phosphooctulonate synthase n=1 Tax=Rubellimicrobium sp. CFH 75288 TaxID=2697034 RepID=UPI001411CC4D|nr:3-deoxy-8-phosphooctulonate synthase [Rubellimicrobium sp. CFH 75288]NAZ36456.1 3-deoxy-8-phosphooctulonate synthase [Rubellimicrobium sp. CFH 75288]